MENNIKNGRPDWEEISKLMLDWRREFHRFPELGNQEFRTSARIKEILNEAQIETQTIGSTGVIGTLSRGSSKVLVLRSDMDALPIIEETNVSYCSENNGIMHACGHDGHMAMLLGAAFALAHHGQFEGTVHFMFQPAEEILAGAQMIVQAGFFKNHPVNALFGMHNSPDIPIGSFATRQGTFFAGADLFEVTITGQGTHAAYPHFGNDVILTAAEVISSLQKVVSRRVDPFDKSVLSVTKINAGTSFNILPEKITFGGTVRYHNPNLHKIIKEEICRILDGICNANKVKYDINYTNCAPPLINNEDETQIAVNTAISVSCSENVNTNHPGSMGAEDFAFLLQEVHGNMMLIGNGGKTACTLHSPRYDFNDSCLIYGARYWFDLVENYCLCR